MVANGVHILASQAVILGLFRARRPEPYLVGAVAAALPDSDVVLRYWVGDFGLTQAAIVTHRGVTHSLLGGILLVMLLSWFGPWRAAAVGVGSHLVLDFLTGGIQLFAPVTTARYGLTGHWRVVNLLTALVAVTVLLVGVRTLTDESDRPSLSAKSVVTVVDRLR